MKNFKIQYYGQDKNLLEALEKEIPNFLAPQNQISFSHTLPDVNHKSLCKIMSSSEIDILLIDLSNNPEIDEALRILYYEIQVKSLQIIGLWNQVQDQNLLKWRFELGINTHFTYQIRDPGSMESLNLALTRLLNIEKEGSVFFQKELNIPMDIYCPIRLNFFDWESAQIESDILFNPGDLLSCIFPAIAEFPFKEFEVTSISKINLNYPYENQANLQYTFYDEFDQIYKSKWDGLDDLAYLDLFRINPAIFKNLDEIQVKSILDQFSKNKSLSHSKRVAIKRLIDKVGKLPDYDLLKNIIVDRNYSPFNFSKDALWKHPYKFYVVRTIEDNLNVLNTCAPNILTYVSPENLDKNNFEESAEFIQLRTICSRLKNLKRQFDRELPLVVTYKIDIEPSKLAEILDYEKIKVFPSSYDFNENLSFIKEYSKSPDFLQNISFYKNQLFKVYPRSNSELSRGFLKKEVEIVSISENEIIFTSPISFKKDFSFMFILEENLRYHATIYKIEVKNNKKIFYGILNSLNEKEKTELRKIIIKG